MHYFNLSILAATLTVAPWLAAPATAAAAAESVVQGPHGLTWLTDLPQAQARAKAEHKPILLFFHGSDWCPTCLEMQRQVFESPEFARFAGPALVLVDVDFPGKRPQPEALSRANAALKAKFNLSPVRFEGFPTIVLLNESSETVYQETGYRGGGPAEVLSQLQRHVLSAAAPARSPAGYGNVGVDKFASLASDPKNVILDVRTPSEFAAGHLPGAVNLDVNARDFEEKARALDPGKTYLVHCASGARSARACEKLGSLDFAKVYNLTGGFKAWKQAGKPVEP